MGQWIEMPVWVYPGPETRGFMEWDGRKSMAAGLTFRPLAETARATLDWWRSGPGTERELSTGLAPEREAEILRAWHARNG